MLSVIDQVAQDHVEGRRTAAVRFGAGGGVGHFVPVLAVGDPVFGPAAVMVAPSPSLPSLFSFLVRCARRSAKIIRASIRIGTTNPVVSVTTEHDRGAFARCSKISGEVSK